MSYESIFKTIDPLIAMIMIMFMANAMKQVDVSDEISWLCRKASINRRWSIFLTSAIVGCLPIPGRISSTSALLDVSTSDVNNKKQLSTLAYVASHHYYLWSPIEKSVMITCAGLGIGYWEFLGVIYPGLICYALGALCLVLTMDLPPTHTPLTYPKRDNLMMIASIFFGIILCLFNLGMSISFLIPFAYCLSRPNVKIKQADLNWKLISIVTAVIVASTFIRQYTDEIMTYVSEAKSDQPIMIALLTMAFSLVLGSSSRFAALVVIGCSLVGPEYLLLFYMIDFLGYFVSPTHKCGSICASIFGVNWIDNQKEISKFALLSILPCIALSLLLMFV